MRKLHQLWRRGAAMCLALLLTLGTTALAAESDDAALRQEDLDFLYHTVLARHPGLFAVTSEEEFLALKSEIEGRLETDSFVEWQLDLMRLVALAKDSHTLLNFASGTITRYYPFSLICRGDAWYLSAAEFADEALLGQEVTALAGRPIPEVIEIFGEIFSADNPVRLRRQFRQACNAPDLYEYLSLTEAGAPLSVTLKNGQVLSMKPIDMMEGNFPDLAYLSNQITSQPVTAGSSSYYAAQPLNDATYYIEYNTCREDPELPMEEFAASVAMALDEGKYSRVILDLRSNSGGSDGVIWPLFSVLNERQRTEDLELIGLIGEATFSSALINAVELQEMGGVLVGEATGGSVCHFGAVRSFALPNYSGIVGQMSSKYIDLNTLLDAGAGRGVVALEPDIAIPQTLEDTLAGKDTAVDWLLAHPEKLSQKEYPEAPLTRGRFVGLLYEAAGSPAVTMGEDLPFTDLLNGIEWYAPALVWAKEAGIAKGGTDGTFSAARPITWQEAAVFMVRFLQQQNVEPALVRSGPLHAALANGWAQGDVIRAWDWGLLSMDADFTQTPTRAQGAAMIEKLAALLYHQHT